MATTKKTTTTPKMPDLSIVAKKTAAEEKEANELASGCRSLTIETPDDYRAGADLVASIKARFEKVEALRKSWVDPLNGVVRSINNFFKPITDGLEESEKSIKSKLSAFVERQSAEHDRYINAASALSKAGNHEAASATLADAAECTVPKVAGLAVREEWIGSVVDASKIPREFLIPDVKALLAVTKSRKDATNIPGWKAEKRRSLAVKAAEDES